MMTFSVGGAFLRKNRRCGGVDFVSSVFLFSSVIRFVLLTAEGLIGTFY
jgi:hypothetical protein